MPQTLTKSPTGHNGVAMQRLLDIVLSVLALLVLSPLLVPIVILLRLTGEGEVFFLQARVGKGGKAFNLYKFATMLKNSPTIGTGTVTVKNDPRILPIGNFLRKTKVNELPQLLNILKGDMSIIGPRPQTQRCFDAFTPASQRAIVQVRPGITGIGSIVFHDEENVLHGHADSVRFYDEVIAPYKRRAGGMVCGQSRAADLSGVHCCDGVGGAEF